MCTAISIKSNNKEVYFGRTLDFSYELDPSIYIVPQNYKWQDKKEYINKYKFIAIGQDVPEKIFIDGVNEKGLGVAALYFQGEADYGSGDNNKFQVGSVNVVNYFLGNFSSVKEILFKINSMEIIGVKDPVTNTVAPLHWFVVDQSGASIVIEPTKRGLEVHHNPIQVLANSPDFKWQLTNLRNYLNLTPTQKGEAMWENIVLKPFGQGGGTYYLPGDYTSPSRFVRVSYLKSFTKIEGNNENIISTCFNILKSVTIPKGVVITNRNTSDYTQYTAFINLNKKEYYFNTYNNHKIIKANINDIDSLNIETLGKLKQKPTFSSLKK